MARWTSSGSIREKVVTAAEKTTITPQKRKHIEKGLPKSDHINLGNSSQQDSSYDVSQQLVKLESKLYQTSQVWDDVSTKLQCTLKDYTKHRDEHQANKVVLDTTESMLHNKVHTLDTALEAAKDVIARGFVDGFSATLKQFQAIYPDLDTSSFNPIKIVVDGEIVDE
ncbi:hypothetical protein VNO80_02967 [Phaseolus coccineus]|uniref:Uncharacterized protein n=1 Tax=Phaseolus coccineus TaxID=3886 RepID=A0AAN9RM12_PHACN